MSKVALPPKKNQQPQKPADEKKIQEVINRGGSTTKKSEVRAGDIKTIAVKLPADTLELIGVLCDKRPKRPGRKLGMAKYDWIEEAVNEKLEREKKEYNIL